MKGLIIKQVLDYYLLPDNRWMFRADIERAQEDFFGNKSKGPSSEEEAGHFSGWFLYDFHLSTGETPLEYFHNKNPLRLPEEDLAIYKDMQENHYDIFEVKGVRKEEGLSLCAARSGDKYEVRGKIATRDLEEGDILICRVIKIGDHYELAGGSSFALERDEKEKKRFLDNAPEKIDPKTISNLLNTGAPKLNYTQDKIAGSDATLISGSFNGAPMQEDDNCAVCRLMRKAKEEGREPTMEEIQRAMKEAEDEKNK